MSVYVDDIFITGATFEEHLQNLKAVLERLEEANLHLNQQKCSFLQPSIEYLGHMIDEHGRHPTEDKIRAIRDAPKLSNITELCSFLGLQ